MTVTRVGYTMSVEDLAGHFWQVIDGSVYSLGLGVTIADGCRHHLAVRIGEVVQAHGRRLIENPVALWRADADLLVFVARMVRHAADQGDVRPDRPLELHEDDFFAALGQCGLLPWCKP